MEETPVREGVFSIRGADWMWAVVDRRHERKTEGGQGRVRILRLEGGVVYVGMSTSHCKSNRWLRERVGLVA